MKREIKFRGKRIDNGKWIIGYLWQDDDDHFPMINRNYTGEDWHQVYDDSVGQYTGIKDRNGIDIYEGDLVRNGGTAKVTGFSQARNLPTQRFTWIIHLIEPRKFADINKIIPKIQTLYKNDRTKQYSPGTNAPS